MEYHSGPFFLATNILALSWTLGLYVSIGLCWQAITSYDVARDFPLLFSFCRAIGHLYAYTHQSRDANRHGQTMVKSIKLHNTQDVLPIVWFTNITNGSPVSETRSSADADNGLDAFNSQSRSTKMVPFSVHCNFSLNMWSAPRTKKLTNSQPHFHSSSML